MTTQGRFQDPEQCKQIIVRATPDGRLLSNINPNTGTPYFTMRKEGWGSGWAAGNLMRLNTVGAMHPIGVVRTVQQGDATLVDDKFSILVLGDRDRT